MSNIFPHGLLFSAFPVMFGLVFVIVIAMFLVTAVKGLSQWNKNNHSPVLTVDAKVTSKRMSVSHHHHHNGAGEGMHTSSSTSYYYATFQVESGDRMELAVSGREYGQLAEGDGGRLTFQGTRYLRFDRVL